MRVSKTVLAETDWRIDFIIFRAISEELCFAHNKSIWLFQDECLLIVMPRSNMLAILLIGDLGIRIISRWSGFGTSFFYLPVASTLSCCVQTTHFLCSTVCPHFDKIVFSSSSSPFVLVAKSHHRHRKLSSNGFWALLEGARLLRANKTAPKTDPWEFLSLPW